MPESRFGGGVRLESLEDGEHREGCVAGEDGRDSAYLNARPAGDPLAVAMDDLAASLLVDRLSAVPGRHRLRDDVLRFDDAEALAAKECRSVGDELLAAVVEDRSERVIVCRRRIRVQGEVGKADVAVRAQHPMKLAYESLLVGLADADVACRLQADDRVERPVRGIERPRVSPDDPHPV